MNKTLMTASYHARFMVGILAAIMSLGFAGAAKADRCSADGSGNWSCSYSYRVNWYSCNGVPLGRGVRYQAPEDAPPPGGWPVAFYYNGTSPADTNPFVQDANASFGAGYVPQVIHELLDDPNGTGKKYAVIAPEPPQSAVLLEFWNTNLPVPYSTTCDYDFFPDFFSEIKSGKYGSASRYNMNKRYAFGISSGGYNSSRMAVTFNQAKKWYQSCSEWCNKDTWKAIAIVSASYANCTGPACYVPGLPSNHPPTKFWQGVFDFIVPKWTAELYHEDLQDDGVATEFVEHDGGHEFTAEAIGADGVKAWFDEFN
ncbi:MAG: hypothetical protein KDA46_07715 [Parvularculaceae bacterium]|nr:hypothetical protein [Parvularculaceae bacterium]